MLVLAQPAGSAAIDSALIAAVVSLLVALLSQLSTSVRDSHARRYERRRAALLDAQDAALQLRRRLREYGQLIRAYPGQPTAEFGEAEQHFDDARSALEVAAQPGRGSTGAAGAPALAGRRPDQLRQRAGPVGIR